jgi:hypothetical protein
LKAVQNYPLFPFDIISFAESEDEPQHGAGKNSFMFQSVSCIKAHPTSGLISF